MSMSKEMIPDPEPEFEGKQYTVDDVKQLRIMIPLGTKYYTVPDSGTAELTTEAKDIIRPRVLEAFMDRLNKDGAVPVEYPSFISIQTREEVGLPELADWVEPGSRVAIYEGSAVLTGDKFPSSQDVAVDGWRKAADSD